MIQNNQRDSRVQSLAGQPVAANAGARSSAFVGARCNCAGYVNYTNTVPITIHCALLRPDQQPTFCGRTQNEYHGLASGVPGAYTLMLQAQTTASTPWRMTR